ncbi:MULTISPECIES: hypothetical protein [Paenibacillus]|uniref:Lipoprotein n=1 Tax=Paenibacillus alvei TaxID=44250 RepID=A0ABT4E9D9_PAEAL|nr:MULTISPECIES: hypothetical protein [Paenibacillus]MCY9530230.1 hypothetical protein [Paenibacillus alvei]SDF66755.1 hypothetical protein SAMN04488689_106125 [Paenibacillus sp. cl6col]
MKRYLLSIILGLCTLGILCTYYTYGAADHLPAYKLVTIQGDPKEGAGIELYGNYSRIGREPLSINIEGSKYRSRETFRDQISSVSTWRNFSEGMGQLIRDYRQFMRGKSSDPNGFYKDNEWLLYAKGNTSSGQSPQKQFQLHVDLLNVKTNEEKQYVTEIPTDSTFDYIYVDDVQRINDQLHVLIMQGKRDESSLYFDYVLDLKSGVLIEGKQVTHWKNSTDKKIKIEVRSLSNDIAPNEYMVFLVLENKVTSRGDYSNFAMLRYAYSYKTGKLFALPDSKPKFNPNTPYYLENNSLVYANYDKNEIQLSRNNLDTGLEERDYVKIEASELGADEIQSFVLTHNRVYILSQKGSTHHVVIVDASNGKTRYVGQVTYEGPESERDKEMDFLRLYSLNIRETAS